MSVVTVDADLADEAVDETVDGAKEGKRYLKQRNIDLFWVVYRDNMILVYMLILINCLKFKIED